MSLTIGLLEIGARGVRMAVGRETPGERLFDLALGAALVGGEMARRAVQSAQNRLGLRASRLLVLPAVSIPLPKRGLRILGEIQQRGRRARLANSAAVGQVLDVLVPVVVEELLDRIDVDALVQDHVDIQTIISGLDLEAVIDQINLNAIVRNRLDIDAIVRSVDIDAVAARLDVDAVMERLNLPLLAQDVIDEIDLPVIIRESSGSRASEAVRGARMHSIEADDAVHRAINCMFRHRGSNAVSASDPDLAADLAVGMPIAAAPVKLAEPVSRSTP